MKIRADVAMAVLALIPAHTAGAATDTPPAWLYPDFIRDPVPADPAPVRMPGSSVSLTRAQIRDTFAAPDWRPGEHPAMPEVVAHGRRPDVWACGYCHYPNGQGRPENGPLAGLPADYILEQMADFKSGARKSLTGEGGRWNMNNYAKAASDDELKAAAAYFSKLRFKPWIEVKEADKVPAVRWEAGLPLAVKGKPDEPIGHRIIELPVDPERTTLRDDASPFVAYVPKGALARGEALATTGGGKTLPCMACHGPQLKGMEPAPPIAGRSPTYIARALYDFKGGGRHGPGSALMSPVAQGLDLDDMIALAAYVASQRP